MAQTRTRAVTVGYIPTGIDLRLTWAPPTLVAPVTWTPTPSAPKGEWGPTQDVIVNLPAAGVIDYNGGIELVGGRNIVVIGGHFGSNTNWYGADGDAGITNRCIKIVGNDTDAGPRTVHLQGIKFDGTELFEGINFDRKSDTRITLQMQHMWFGPCRWKSPPGGGGGHHGGDYFQPINGPWVTRTDMLWMSESTYQAFFLQPRDRGEEWDTMDFRRTQFIGSDAGHAQLLAMNETPDTSAFRNLTDVWVKNGASNTLAQSLKGNWVGVNQGVSPVQWVGPDDVGLGYVNPGYLSQPATVTRTAADPVGVTDSVSAVLVPEPTPPTVVWSEVDNDLMDYANGSTLAAAPDYLGDTSAYNIFNNGTYRAAFINVTTDNGSSRRTWKDTGTPDHRARARIKVESSDTVGGIAGVVARVTDGATNIGWEFVKTTAGTSPVGALEAKIVLYKRTAGVDADLVTVQLPGLAYNQVLDVALAPYQDWLIATVRSVDDGGAAVDETVAYKMTPEEAAIFTGTGAGLINLLGANNFQALAYDVPDLGMPALLTHGRELDDSMVGLAGAGIDYSELTVHSGSYQAVQGETIEGLDITGDLRLYGPGGQFTGLTGVTVRHCRIRGVIAGGYVGTSPNDRLIEWNDLTGESIGTGPDANISAIDNRGYTARRNLIEHYKRGPMADRHVVIEENIIRQTWGQQYGPGDWDHRALIGSNQGGHQYNAVRRNVLDARPWTGAPSTDPTIGLSAVIVAYDEPGQPISDMDFDDNVLIGGRGYVFYITKGYAAAPRIRVRGNDFDRTVHAQCAEEGVLGSSIAGAPWTGSEWTNNRWTQPGTPTAGTLVPAPGSAFAVTG